MAEDIPFISEADLEAVLGVGIDGSELIFVIAMDSACDTVRSYLGQRINRVLDETIYLDGSGRDAVRLPERPVRNVDAVLEDGATLVAGTDFFLRGSNLIKPLNNVWRVGRLNVQVTYDHGYDVTAPLDLVVPADIRIVALNVARRVYKSVANAAVPPSGLQGETIGAYSYTIASLPPELVAALNSASALLEPEKALLDPYRVAGPKSGSRS